MKYWLALVFSIVFPFTSAEAFEWAIGPTLGAASNFGQNWQPRALDGGEALGITEFRDEVIWNHVEQPDGRLAFESMRESYPELFGSRGLSMVLLGYSGHPNWDGGLAPQSPEGQAAFARYHARILRRFSSIHSVEIGNEYNSDEFAAGENWPDDLAERAKVYVRLLAATKRAIHAVDPEIRILGGAAHSVPLAWIEAVMAAGGAAHMDSFVLHPYTTAPEQLARQIAAMRSIPELAEMPVEITEFGTEDIRAAPHYLLRMYCQMAISGVTRAIWYPFSPRGDGLIPLVTEEGWATPAGLAYSTVGMYLEGLPVEDAAPDPFTYACRFGDRAMVIWGAPRRVELAEDLRVLSATGQPLMEPFVLSRSEPVLIVSDSMPVRLGETVSLAPQQVRADSFDQFGSTSAADTGFSVFIRQGGTERPLEPRPGQERDGVPWTPYLGFSQDGEVRVGPDWASPSSWGESDPLSIVYFYRSDRPQTVKLTAHVVPDPNSDDGVTMTFLRNGEVLEDVLLNGPRLLSTSALELSEGDTLRAILGPNRNADGDFVRIRVRVETP